MNRKKFALSWGRKIFFGIGWPLFCLIGLNYFRAQIIPASPISIFYFILTYVGHYGLLSALLYFVFYYPLVYLFSAYYFSRFWSLLLILATSILLFLDSLIFARYHFHINGFILNLFFSGAGKSILDFPTVTFVMLGTASLVLSIFIWIRGEWVWRSMQRRFSNENKNWYLILIVACLSISNLMHIYGDAAGNVKITRMTQLFPALYSFTGKNLMAKIGITSRKFSLEEKDVKNFYYPSKKISCPGKDNKNILYIFVGGLRQDDVSETYTPALNHYSSHANVFKNHHSGSAKTQGGIFSLFYALPSSYLTSAQGAQTSPVILSEAKKRSYDTVVFSAPSLNDLYLDQNVFFNVSNIKSFETELNPKLRDEKVNLAWLSWVNNYSNSSEQKPFIGFLYYDSPHFDIHEESLILIDKLISQVMEDLLKKALLKDTVIVITGDSGQVKVPMLVIWPERKSKVTNHLTSHYDISPTLMSNLWGCNNDPKDYSFGDSLYSSVERDWHLAATPDELSVIDYKQERIVSLNPRGSYVVTDLEYHSRPTSEARETLILDILRDLVRFNKKK